MPSPDQPSPDQRRAGPHFFVDQIDYHLQIVEKNAEEGGIDGIREHTMTARERAYGALCPPSSDLLRIYAIKDELGLDFMDQMQDLVMAFTTLGGLRTHPSPSLTLEQAERELVRKCRYIVHAFESYATLFIEHHPHIKELFSIVARHLQTEKEVRILQEVTARLDQLMQQEKAKAAP